MVSLGFHVEADHLYTDLFGNSMQKKRFLTNLLMFLIVLDIPTQGDQPREDRHQEDRQDDADDLEPARDVNSLHVVSVVAASPAR